MPTTSTIRKRLSQARRETILTAYRRSQLTQREFANQAWISVSALQLWAPRYQKGQALGQAPRSLICLDSLSVLSLTDTNKHPGKCIRPYSSLTTTPADYNVGLQARNLPTVGANAVEK